MTNDKRQFKRSPIELAASYGIPDESLILEEARIIDVSGGGFCIQSKNKIERKKTIQLVFELDNGEECVLPVKIAWQKIDPATNNYIYGVQIHYPNHLEYNKLLAFVDKFHHPSV